jgi:hypothetical protein
LADDPALKDFVASVRQTLLVFAIDLQGNGAVSIGIAKNNPLAIEGMSHEPSH